jgi:hypothetical protein
MCTPKVLQGTLGVPWSGSFKAICVMLYGDNVGIPLLNINKPRTVQSSLPSLLYPRESAFNKSEALVETLKRKYTLGKLFVDANLLDQRDMWNDKGDIASNSKSANVELWCP